MAELPSVLLDHTDLAFAHSTGSAAMRRRRPCAVCSKYRNRIVQVDCIIIIFAIVCMHMHPTTTSFAGSCASGSHH